MAWLSDFFFIHDTFIRALLLDIVLAYSVFLTFRAGMWSLAQAGAMAMGAYVTAILVTEREWSFLLAVPAGVVAATVAATVLVLPALRLQGAHLAIATLAFVELVRVAAVNLEVTGGAAGLSGLPSDVTIAWLTALAAAVVGVVWLINRSRVGEASGLHHTSPLLAQSLGVNLWRLRLTLTVLSFAIAALGAAVGTHVFRVVGPHDYGFTKIVELLTFVIVGGTSALAGPIVGVLVLNVPAEFLGLGEYKLLFDGALLLAAILFFPGGLTRPSEYRGPRLLLRGLMEGPLGRARPGRAGAGKASGT